MNTHHDDRFDDAIRAQHAASLEQVSPRVRAQLAQRRNAALRGEGRRRGHVVRYAAAGLAALGVLAIGLQLGHMPAPSAPATSTAIPATTPVATMLDEDPEFYAWLASPDAQQAAME